MLQPGWVRVGLGFGFEVLGYSGRAGPDWVRVGFGFGFEILGWLRPARLGWDLELWGLLWLGRV